MTTSVNRWGTSYGIRITKPIIELFPVSDKQKLDVEITGDKIIFTRSKEIKSHKTLAEYLEEYGWDGKTPTITDEDREWLDMPTAGKEEKW